MKALRCTNVYKIFGKDPEKAVKHLKAGGSREDLPEDVTVAVDNVSLEIEEGEIFVVMGLSGSGKSTLLRTLNALGPATSGTILVGDQDITQMSLKEIRKLREERLSMVFQHFGLLPHRTVLENAAYPLEIQGVDRKEREARAMEALKTTGLEGREHAYPDELSGGMQQRVGLARALTADADILLMDEAFSALDPLIRRDMQELLLEIQQQKRRTIVFITHDLNEAMYVGDRIAVMREGQVVQVGTAEEILTNPANDYIARFVQDVDRTRVITASAMMRQPGTRIYSGDGPRVVLKKLEEWDEDGGWVTDAGTRKLRGLIHTEDVVRALSENPDLDTTKDLLRTDFVSVHPDATLADVIALSAGSPITIPVVESDGKLAGIIPRIAVLIALATVNRNDDAPLAGAQAPAEETAPAGGTALTDADERMEDAR
ncbi:glycine betaine/proline transport system ATP-binding protein [Trueperella bonasi]|uniref:Glycine betaine/proline transport system ATP-binding protein n=1 Tax=Trueperella bonasi TaxID=312286 RepID=A0ABT9NFY5_9ACTO|nr:glycine betaine/L-proline ABC transporter ATP-binding protein [Trueperella bonasi]MDP9806275.1 glycine betaine/proline transport system ATP-binding protein [Trueperella bonasi]